MALLDSELQRIRFELGYNNLSVGAEPYISYVAIFDKVIKQYINSGAKTTSATYVAPLASGAPPALLQIALVDATGFSPGDAVWLDGGVRQEQAAVETLAGSTITVQLSNAHGNLAGTSSYPVTVEGGEAIVRQILANIAACRSQMQITPKNAALLASGGGLKKVDEIEFFGQNQMNSSAPSGGAVFANLNAQINYWRRELASSLGVTNAWERRRGGGGGSVAIY